MGGGDSLISITSCVPEQCTTIFVGWIVMELD